MNRVGVFLSSSQAVSPSFHAEAEVLGAALADAGYGVVYGGSNEGCMGGLAKGVLDRKGELTGVVPEMDFLDGLVQADLTRKIAVRDLSERKWHMIRESDAFLVFPGGLGTLDEITDVLALRQINSHQKPIIFYNYLDYWTPFIECLETFYLQRMIAISPQELFVALDGPSRVVDYLNACFRK